ncbi:hypothetical protein GCM10009682_29130 [Luedemannella flava]|uniref:Uncharacterized protein n=1 Tax=Luedemannella flava TaxID=349316 RepID=A0ABN2M0V2_9ACTN
MVGLRALVVLFLVVLSVPAAAAHAAAPARPTAGWYGVDILGTNLILRADGSQVPLRPPAGQVATMAAGVPSGWVLYMKEPESARAALWFVPLAGGAGQRISPVSGNWKLSHDGTRLVIAGVGDSPAELRTVLLVDLPSLRVVARTEVNTDSNGLNAVGITPDGVVLRESWLENTPTGAAIWDPRTGDVRWARERLWALGTTADGRLLARWSLGSWRSRRSCISLAPVTGSFRRPRYCAGVPRSVIDGYISPDGSVAHLMFNVTEFEYQWGMVRTADVLRGRWRYATLPEGAAARLEYWDTDRTAIFTGDYRSGYRCNEFARCDRFDLPNLVLGQIGPQVVARYGRRADRSSSTH